MIIVLDDPSLGKFSWQLPEELAEKFRDASRIMREELGVEEEVAVAAEKLLVEKLQKMIAAFLQLLVLVQAAPGPSSLQATDMVAEGIGRMVHTACLIIPDENPEDEEE